MRLDRWFKRRVPALSLGHLNKICRTGQVRVDGARAQTSTRLAQGASVRVPPLKLDAPAKPASEPGAAETPTKRDAVAEEDRPKPARASDSPDLVLHAARNESWVEITDRAGEKLWTGTVKRGGRIGVTGKPPYSVVIGNARDVDVTWRQRPVKLGRTIQNGTARGTIGEPD